MKWTNVKDALPPDDALYIVHAPSGDPDRPMIHIAWYNPNGFGWSMLPQVWIDALTHWMPLPKPPEKGEGL